MNLPITWATVRLRDARAGRIVTFSTTDHAGLFEFPTVEPGSYVVELLDKESRVLAASEILNPNAGDFLATVIRIPSQIPAAAGFAHPTALLVTATAAAAGVLATIVVGDDVSPRR
ncbi:MAG TPA: hypothetical protein VH583_24240 [Vicinamibacterales bacterium]